MPKLHRPEELILSNGMPVILQHTDAPVAATYWWVKTGSADEAPDEAGFAHFLEHMLFKDAAAKETGKASTGQMARAIESLGGDINAYTSFDQTVYHVTCAAHHWEKVLDAFGTMAKPQRFLKSDFEREREVILEELRKNEDSPGRQLFQGLFTSTYSKHPYGRPVIGFVKTLKAATVAKLEAFYRRNYVAGNMGLVLVGPFADDGGKRRESILKLLEKHFGAKVLPKKSHERRKRPEEASLRKGVATVVKKFDVKTPTIAISFRAPSLMHDDIPALDLASNVLAMGELSRLYQNLFYQKSMVTDISGGLYVPNDPGMFYVQAETESMDRIEAVATEIFQELKRLQTEGPTAEELARVLVNAESERLYATQTADGMAGRLGFLRYILGDLKFDQEYLEDLRAVDAAKIREVACRYFDYRRMNIALLIPKDKDFDLSGVVDQGTRILAPAGGAAEVPARAVAGKGAKGAKKSKSDVRAPAELFTRPSGIKVIYRENPGSHVMSVHSCALGGLRLELADPVSAASADWGSSYMMSLTWTKGAGPHNAREIAAMVEGKAASLDGFAGRNTVGLQMTGLARDWSELSDTYSLVLTQPTFNEEEVGHSRRVAEDSVRGIEDHSSQLCSKLFLETLFEKHPYGHLTTGSLESLSKIDSRKLEAFHRKWVRPERLIVSVAGAVKRSQLDEFLDQLDERLARMKPAAGTGGAGASVAEEPELKAPRWVEKHLGREQLHILVGGLGSRILSEERYALRLMQTLLGGQSGRLFIELREKKSLAYTVAPVSFEGVERGYIGTYIACSPGKRDEAIQGIRKVLENLAAKGPTPAEMKRAKEFYLGRRAMELQSDSANAAHYSLQAVYGITPKDEQQVMDRINAVTAREIQEVCRKYLVDPHQVTSVVG